MSHDPDHNHRVRRVVLPSGRSIEVVYFEPLPGADQDAALPHVAPDQPAASPQVDEDLHLCPECDAGFVYPLEWEEVSRTQWEVDLRCPNCEWHHTGVYAQDLVDRFDDELDRGMAVIVRDLKRLTRANMEEELDRFTTALESDAVWPIDF